MPKRPPKAWFDRCLRSVSRDPGVDDPSALCGWVWYHHMTPTRALKLLKDGSLRYDPHKRNNMCEGCANLGEEGTCEHPEMEKWYDKGMLYKVDETYRKAEEGKCPFFVYWKHDPSKAWDEAMKVSGKMLVISRAKAGLRKGKQAFTDLVEVAVNLPSRVYDRLVSEGFFTEYEKGSAARRGKSKRGTNIFISKRK